MLILTLFILNLTAQTTSSFGVRSGFALSQHYGTKGDPADMRVSLSMRPGLYAGVWMDLRVLPNLALGYELLYSQKGSRESIRIFRMENDLGEMETLAKPAEMKVKYYMDYLELPILLKVTTLEKTSWALQVHAGTAMGIRINGDHELEGRIYLPDGDDFDEVTVTDSSNLEYVNIFDFSFIYGGSIIIKRLLPLSIDYRFTLGWDHLDLPTFQGFEPARLRNQSYHFGLSWTF